MEQNFLDQALRKFDVLPAVWRRISIADCSYDKEEPFKTLYEVSDEMLPRYGVHCQEKISPMIYWFAKTQVNVQATLKFGSGKGQLRRQELYHLF